MDSNNETYIFKIGDPDDKSTPTYEANYDNGRPIYFFLTLQDDLSKKLTNTNLHRLILISVEKHTYGDIYNYVFNIPIDVYRFLMDLLKIGARRVSV